MPDTQKWTTTVRNADEELLATLGYKQEFKREFKPIEVFGIAFSIIGLVSSMTSVLFNAIPNGGGPAMVWGWAVASIFILIVGLAMAELASAAPTSGGLYFWTFSYSSPRWRNLLCWIVGYANTIGATATFSSINWGCAVEIFSAVEIVNPSFETTTAKLYGLYAAIVISHTLLCSLGTIVLARLQGLYVVLNIALSLAVIIALPIATPSELKNSTSFALGEFVNLNGWPDGYAFIMSFLFPLWTISNFDSCVHISEEASNASRMVPLGIIGAVGMSGLLGFGINLSLAFCMGTDLESIYTSPQPMAAIFNNSLGKNGTLVLWSFVILIQYMMGSSMLLAASRQSYAFSRDHALPFSFWVYRMNRYTGTPVNAVIFVACFALLLGLLAFAGNAAINAVFAISVTALYIAYSIPISARWLGDNKFKPGPFSLGFMSLPISIIAVVFMVFLTIVFLFPATPQTSVQDMNYTCVVLLGILLLSLVWYYFPKYGGVHWFTGPVANIHKMGIEVSGLESPDSEIQEKEMVNASSEVSIEEA